MYNYIFYGIGLSVFGVWAYKSIKSFIKYRELERRIYLIENLVAETFSKIRKPGFEYYIVDYYRRMNDFLISRFAPLNDEYLSNEIRIEVVEKESEIHLKLIKPTLKEPMWYILKLDEHPFYRDDEHYRREYKI